MQQAKIPFNFQNYINRSNVSITQHIQAFHEAPRMESKTDGCQVKLSQTQKIALRAICKEENTGVSTWIGDAIEQKMEMLPYRDKFKRYKKAILTLLDSLP